MNLSNKKAVFLLVIGMLCQSSAYAEECDTVQFLDAKSPGTAISKNNCKDNQGLSIGTQLELSAGARVWLKATHDNKHIQQLICQNRSNDFVHLTVASQEAPWISVDNLKNCNKWANDRLNCKISTGNTFFCMTGIVKQQVAMVTRQERTTSVSMRAIALDNPQNIPTAEDYADKAVAEMQGDIKLCRELFNSKEPVELIWNVSVSGKVDDVSILSEGSEELSSCIRDVVADYSYAKPEEMVTFVYEF